MNDSEPIDRVLSDFFRNERPDPWPAVRRPVSAMPRRDNSAVSRVALAASAAALFGIGVVLSSGGQVAKPSGKGAESLLPGATASGERLLLPRPVEPVPMPMP